MEHHGSTGTVAVCGNCGSCCTLLEIPSAGRLGSLGRGFHRQAEHRSSVAHLQNCGCLGVVVQVCLSAANRRVVFGDFDGCHMVGIFWQLGVHLEDWQFGTQNFAHVNSCGNESPEELND